MNEEYSTEPWECGSCHAMTTESHYYPDALNVLQHEVDPRTRRALIEQGRRTRERMIAEGHQFPNTNRRSEGDT